VLWIINNQLKVDRIYRDKHGEKKKIKICVNLVNPVQKGIFSLLDRKKHYN
jgi:hypothetical protein